ncbi:hypothetical protein DVH05_017211 [Phytophthora capsici]|nr:hypothetical protein DVH05_017211 [Phytophthora capsici]
MRMNFLVTLVAVGCVLLSANVVQAEEGRLQVGQAKRSTRRIEETEEKFFKINLPKFKHPQN